MFVCKQFELFVVVCAAVSSSVRRAKIFLFNYYYHHRAVDAYRMSLSFDGRQYGNTRKQLARIEMYSQLVLCNYFSMEIRSSVQSNTCSISNWCLLSHRITPNCIQDSSALWHPQSVLQMLRFGTSARRSCIQIPLHARVFNSCTYACSKHW